MSATLYLVLGNQLFKNHPLLSQINRHTDKVIMIESAQLCSRLLYHKQKLVFILTCMREYADYLLSLGVKVEYYRIDQEMNFDQVFKLKSQEFTHLAYSEIPNKEFSKYIFDIGQQYFQQGCQILNSPQFLIDKNGFANYLRHKPYKRLLMTDFYIHQRKKLKILVDTNQQPIAGQWSFDEDNRKKIPKQLEIPERGLSFSSKHFLQLKGLVQNQFARNPGQIWNENSWLPVNHTQAQEYLCSFFREFLSNFGDYEDALTQQSDFVFHSILSPLLNNGLLTPIEVLTTLDEYLNKQYDFSIFEQYSNTSRFNPKLKLNSIEGFIRQIIGWREWVKGMYDTQYVEPLANYNFFVAKNNLPDYFWDESKLDCQELQANLPLRIVLKKVFKYGYCHHIERLIILSNWSVLSEYKPDEVYKWFMSMFVDAYEWVMIPNVIGMGLFADGGIFATKPYISGGNYIVKMSDYKKGEWEKLWTDKFWGFLEKHKTYFQGQPRLAMLLKSRNKKPSK